MSTDGIEELRRAFGNRTVIALKTNTWAVWFHKSEPRRYAFAYRVQAKLLRLEDFKVLWKGECPLRSQDATTAPTLEELKANDGALLKAKSKEVAESCSKDVSELILGTPSRTEPQ